MSRPALALNAWLRYDAVLRLLDRIGRIESVLEVGCGLGAMGVRLAAGRDYVGVEPDSASRDVASRRLPTVVASLEEVGERRFDLVCAFEVLEHLRDDRQALELWSAHVAPGGALMLSAPAYPERWGPSDVLAGHFRRYRPDQLRRLLLEAGMDDVDILVYGGPLGYVLEAARDTIARARWRGTADQSPEALTGRSGRLLQPPDRLDAVTAAVSKPFRLLQRRMPSSGTGLVVAARQPGGPGEA